MTDFKVTDGMRIAGYGIGARHWGTSEAIAAALAHPDFRAQVAELMRGMTRGRDVCLDDVLDNIKQWEQGND